MNHLRRVASLPGVRAVLLRPPVRRRVASVLALRFLVAAFRTTTPMTLVTREVTRRGAVETYRIRDSGRLVALQHGRDLEALYEVFSAGEYEPPVELAGRLRPDRVRRVLDVGANVGMFTSWARGRWPQASVVAVEPSETNLAVLRRMTRDDDAVEVLAGALSTAEGEVAFVDGWGSGSHVAGSGGGEATTTVSTFDYLPLFADADVVKMDIEGGEWDVLTDPRLADVGPLVLVMEYHRVGAPSLPAREAAERLLTAASFRVGHGRSNHWGHGTLWAWRD